MTYAPLPYAPALPFAARPWTIHEGDNRCALDIYEAETFDAVVTDCPYGLSTELDPPNLDRVKRWEAIACEPNEDGELSLPIRELITSWMLTGENPIVTGKGFMGNEWDSLVPPPNAWRAVWRVMKPGAYLFTFAGTRTDDLVTLSLRFAGFRIEDRIIWAQGTGMAKRRRLDLAIDTHLGMKDQRPVLGKHPNPAGNDGSGIMRRFVARADEPMLTGAATPEAARFVGWDRGLHPRHEPIVIASKPMRGKVAETVLRYGTGGMNVDGCRIARGDAGPLKWDTPRGMGYHGAPDSDDAGMSQDARGGYPTNVILSEEAAAELDAQTGDLRNGVAVKHNTAGKTTGRIFKVKSTGVDAGYGGSGGASKFFYVAKAATSERDKGLEAMPVMTPGERSGREDGSAGINGYAGTRAEARNPGPCIKPIALLRHLARLACPPGAHDPDLAKRPLVLDPYMGTGSMGVACMVEGLTYVGCEIGGTYAEVARCRLQHAYTLPRDETGEASGEADVDTAAAAAEALRGSQGRLF